ncbi:MAG: hypothetical protein QNJ40_23000 [Xanthomonadales bacterium]|nr:hypothetical protein [Xanthomonadales bacterium]
MSNLTNTEKIVLSSVAPARPPDSAEDRARLDEIRARARSAREPVMEPAQGRPWRTRLGIGLSLVASLAALLMALSLAVGW